MQKPPVAVAYVALLVLPVLLGLAVSGILFVDYSSPAPVFCDPAGGCERIRASGFSSFMGIPLPVFGLAAFLALGTLTLLRGRIVRGMFLGLAGISAVIAALLILIQVQQATFCPFCMVVDISACVLAVGAVLRFRKGWDLPGGTLSKAAFSGAMVLGVAVPLGVGFSLSPDLPEPIQAELHKTPAGKITVIDFVDFECPFCRLTHQEFGPVLEQNASRIRVVRKQVPLKMHPNAMDAARAACCGEKLGKGDAMADALFLSEDLSPQGCEKVAENLGLDLSAYRDCLKDPSIDERIKTESAEFRAARGRGLPTIWINGQKFEGMQEEGTLQQAMAKALSSKS